MVSVSPAFQAAATADERRVVGYLYKGNEKLYGGDVIQSMKITELCGGGEDLVPGVCACSEAEAVLLNLDGALDGVFQTGQELILHLGFLTENGEETVPMGVFAITSVENQDGKITLKLSDRMLRLEQPVTIETQGANPVLRFGEKARTLYLPYTLAALFSGLCYVMDMEFTSITFPNNTYVPGNVLEGETSGRNLLAYIAQAAGCFARMDRNGRLELKSYTAADAPLGLDDYFTVKEAGFSVPAITALTVRAEEGDVGRTIGEPGVSYVITGNPLLYRLNSMSDYAPIMQTILDGMGARPYAPMEIEARGNPAVQAGDILTAALRDGRTAALPVMTHTLTYNGGLRDTLGLHRQGGGGRRAEGRDRRKPEGAQPQIPRAGNRRGAQQIGDFGDRHPGAVHRPRAAGEPGSRAALAGRGGSAGAAGMERQRVDNGGGQDHGDFLRRAADQGRHHHGFPQRQGQQLHGVHRRGPGHLRQPQGHRGPQNGVRLRHGGAGAENGGGI